eukprot:scaffold19200_cov60-Phaeocystis_antarctica.AAC.3
MTMLDMPGWRVTSMGCRVTSMRPRGAPLCLWEEAVWLGRLRLRPGLSLRLRLEPQSSTVAQALREAVEHGDG